MAISIYKSIEWLYVYVYVYRSDLVLGEMESRGPQHPCHHRRWPARVAGVSVCEGGRERERERESERAREYVSERERQIERPKHPCHHRCRPAKVAVVCV